MIGQGHRKQLGLGIDHVDTELSQHLGVHVIDAEPELLPVALTDHYLLLKSRGLL